jgi:hypothetical protein
MNSSCFLRTVSDLVLNYPQTQGMYSIKLDMESVKPVGFSPLFSTTMSRPSAPPPRSSHGPIRCTEVLDGSNRQRCQKIIKQWKGLLSSSHLVFWRKIFGCWCPSSNSCRLLCPVDDSTGSHLLVSNFNIARHSANHMIMKMQMALQILYGSLNCGRF